MPKHDPTFTDRDQSKDPETCMVAVRKLAMNWGVGIKVQLKMDRRETLNYYMFRKMGFAKLADDIMSGKIRHTGADDDLPPKVEIKREGPSPRRLKVEPSAIAPAKRKRKRSVVKEEPYDSDFVERPPEPKRKKRKKTPTLSDTELTCQHALDESIPRKRKPKPKPKPKRKG